MSSPESTNSKLPRGVWRVLWGAATRTLWYVLVGCLGASFVLVTFFVIYLEKRPDLHVWHTAKLDVEFKASSKLDSFEEYLVLEDRLFEQLHECVHARIQPDEQGHLNRFHQGSLSDPEKWPRNWNRTFEFPAQDPKAGVLLLHGMSDSPYSLRNLGERLNAQGCWVIGLRIPGHGTAPSGLVNVKWEDMAAAVRIGMGRLKEKVGERPLSIVGYSNGGALGVQYALSGLENEALPKVSSLVLISPAIGVAPVAAFAVWQARLGHILGLPKLEWSSIQPEYDPFKYGSFAVNAGDQVFRLTQEIKHHLDQHISQGDLSRFPPVLAFQSAVDGTVSTRALVEGLFERLSPGKHELVVLDINRVTEVERILVKDPKTGIDLVMRDANLPFAVSLVTNAATDTQQVVVRYKKERTVEPVELPLDLTWPEGVYSLSHVALPFPMEDPLYGMKQSQENPGIFLGNVALRGERGVLQISASDMLRLRHNPFYPYIEQRLLEFLKLGG